MRDKCKAYSARKQREKNKQRKVAKHVTRHPKDEQAVEYLRNFKVFSVGA